MTTLENGFFMMNRHLLNLLRQPIWIAVTLVQPVIWLLLYGALFKNVTRIPGFRSGSYIQFLTPGIVVMTALFSAGWSGMALIDDIDKGILDRFLVSPVSRASLVIGRLLNGAVTVVVQSLIIVLLGLAVGARYPNAWGIVVLIALAALLAASVGCLSLALALIARREETVIAAANFFLLPLTFLSTAFMQRSLVPRWIQHAASVNPVNWAVEAGRASVLPGADWGMVLARLGLLAALCGICIVLATLAFGAYKRAV
jgi:ABC-2 type transport system permease protein